MKQLYARMLVAVAFCSVATWLSATPIQWTVSSGGNGHWYERVDVSNGISWVDAGAGAVSMGGYLASITSGDESLFVTNEGGLGAADSDLLHYHWLGGFQPDGSAEPDGGWAWVTGETWSFTHWAGGEPNNYGDEKLLAFDHGIDAWGKGWNDLPALDEAGAPWLAAGYLVEWDSRPAPVPDSSTTGGMILLAGVCLLIAKRR